MPVGVERSPYTPIVSKTIGWSLGKLRARLNKAGYDAPYKDPVRILKILHAQGVDVTKLFKVLNLDPSCLNEHTNNTQLILAPAPSPQGLGALASHLDENASPLPLMTRLAQLLPGDDTIAEKRVRVRMMLNDAGMDGRTKDEVGALKVLQDNGVATDNFIWSGSPASLPAVSAMPDVENMPVDKLRATAKFMVAEIVRMEKSIKTYRRRERLAKEILQQAEHLYRVEAPTRRWTKSEFRAFMALEELEESFEEET